ncbi:MAG: adenylate/guanylate cyclase domain-containing protein [Myxococcota bacterium]|nr:adenylate/guanylate cyclase domain-containing protein [Myxococcota bacterium]
MPEAPDRRLAAILFTDVVGYSALMATDEERGLEVRARHRALVAPLVERFRGESIELRGDECLSVFPSALDAVQCALALLDAVEREPDLDLHLGIHAGDVVRVGDEVSGDGVNVARRLCALTEGGGLCVSGEVRQAVRNQPEVEARALGARELKNVGRPVEVFALGPRGRVRPEALPSPPETRRRRVRQVAAAALLVLAGAAGLWATLQGAPAARPPIGSIAVLPLENLTGDPDQEYFAEGMTEALITSLARIGALRVTSRTTVLRFKDTGLSLPEIARELDVDALIEGSILRDGGRVRITTQLIDARDDEHLWAEQFDREVRDVLSLQSEVARGVARMVEAQLTPREAEKLAARGPVVPEAHEAYLKGIYFANKHTPPAALRARAHFEEAMRLDPSYPLGYAGLADTLSCSPMHTWVIAGEGEDALPTAVMDLAWELAHRAIELDRDLAEAQTALGLVRMFRSWDWDGAFEAFDLAVETSPSYEFARRGRAYALAYQGRFEEARRDMDHALEVDPLNAQVTHLAGLVYEWLGETERAVALYRESTALDAVNPNGGHSLGMLRCKQGAVDEGLALLAEAREVSHDDPLVVGDLGWCHARGGDTDRARALLAELGARAAAEWVSPIALARIHAGLGEYDQTLVQLERAYAMGAYRLVELGVDDRWDPMRADPRFRELLRKIGLAERRAEAI